MATENNQASAQGGVPSNVYAKIHAVMNDVGYVQKDKENKAQGYWYASEKAILDRVHEAMFKNRLVFVPVRAEVIGRVPTLSGKQITTTIRLTYRFVNIDKPEDFHEGVYEGDGADNGDKAIYKALTGTVKYIVRNTFMISTGDDPEEPNVDDYQDPKDQKVVSQKQVGAPSATKPAGVAGVNPSVLASAQPKPVPPSPVDAFMAQLAKSGAQATLDVLFNKLLDHGYGESEANQIYSEALNAAGVQEAAQIHSTKPARAAITRLVNAILAKKMVAA